MMKVAFALAALSAMATCKAVSAPYDVDAGQGPAPAPTAVIQSGVAVANDVCTLIEGVTPNKTVISVCATIEEIETIASSIGLLKTNAASAPCSDLPHTNVCATPAQRGAGIQMILNRRRMRLMIDDGGAE